MFNFSTQVLAPHCDLVFVYVSLVGVRDWLAQSKSRLNILACVSACVYSCVCACVPFRHRSFNDVSMRPYTLVAAELSLVVCVCINRD